MMVSMKTGITLFFSIFFLTLFSIISFATDSWTESGLSCGIGTASCLTSGFCSVAANCRTGLCAAPSCASRANAYVSSQGRCSKAGCKCTVSECAGGTATCNVDGSCTYTCNSDWHSDDGVTSDGCENGHPQWYTPTENTTTPTAGSVVQFDVNWTDMTGDSTTTGLGVNYTWFEWNISVTCTAQWTNLSYTTQSNSQSLWFNISQTIPSQCSVGTVIAWRQYANDSINRVNVSQTRNITVTSADTTKPTYSLNSTNSTLAGTPVKHNLKWTDNIGLSGYIFSFDNCTGTFANDSFVSFSGTTNWSNVTKTINSTVGCTIQWKVYANDTSNNWNASENFSLVTSSAVFIDIIPSSNLEDGIQFSNVDPGTNDNAATRNSACNSGTCYNISIDPATTVNVDLYHKASGNLGTINIQNVTHQSNITDNNGNNLIASGSISLTTSYAIIGTDVCQNLADNENCWIRYWFDVPSGQSPGDIETTYYYCAVENGAGSGDCT